MIQFDLVKLKRKHRMECQYLQGIQTEILKTKDEYTKQIQEEYHALIAKLEKLYKKSFLNMNRLEQVYNAPISTVLEIHKSQVNIIKTMIGQLDQAIKMKTYSKLLYTKNKELYSKMKNTTKLLLKYSPLPTPVSSEFTDIMRECDLLRYTEIITKTKYDIDGILQSMCETITGLNEKAAKDSGKKNLSVDYSSMSDKELADKLELCIKQLKFLKENRVMKRYTNEDIERMSASIRRDEDNGDETDDIENNYNSNGTRLVRNKLVPKRSQSASISSKRPSNNSNNNSSSLSSTGSATNSRRVVATSKPERKLSEDELKYGDENAGQITTIKKFKETHHSSESEGDVGVRQLARKKLSNKRSSSAIVGGSSSSGRGRNGGGKSSPERPRNRQYVDQELNALDQDVGERLHALETMFKNPSISLSTTTESSSRSTFRHS